MFDIAYLIEETPVFQSQVAEQLMAIQELGIQTGLVAQYSDRQLFEKTIGQRLRDHGVHVSLVSTTSFAQNFWRMSRVMRALGKRCRIRAMYVRGLWGPLLIRAAWPLQRKNYVYDVRGALADESLASDGGAVKRRAYVAFESNGIRNATHVTAVTDFLAKSVETSIGCQQVKVVPSCVNANTLYRDQQHIDAKRREFGYSPSDVVIIYSGGLSHYQQVPVMMGLWRRLLGDIPQAKFLLLTNEDPAMKVELGDLGVFGERLRHQVLKKSEVEETLSAADIGFMMRDGRELNQAASPVKFAEYVAAGLSIVGSPKTGDASRYITERNIGVLVDPKNIDEGYDRIRDLIQSITSSRQEYRERSLQLARDKYDWDAYASIFRKMYGG